MKTTSLVSPTEILRKYNDTFDQPTFGDQYDKVYDGVYYFIRNEGKQIRPLLLMLACDMLGGDIDKALNPAYAIQMFHNSTLVHDDIIDKSEYRRGQLTVNKKFGRNTAIMAGDMMFIIAYEYLLNHSDNSNLHQILKIFNQTAVKIMEGQQIDLEFENRDHISEDEYLSMIECKTSVLIAASMEIGAIIAEASEQNCHHIYEFGRNIGIAFQIKDDWLDVFGSAELTGKKIGQDIVRNKKTYLFVKALQLANEEQKIKIDHALKQTDDNKKINKVLELYHELNIQGHTKEKMNYFYDKAFHHLALIDIDPYRKESITEITNQLYTRKK